MTPLKLAVVGIGYFGNFHAQILNQIDSVHLIGICDIDQKRTAKKAKQLKTTPYFNHRDLIGKVDGVSIVTPTTNHYEIAKDFLSNKIPVLIEKPITTTLDEANDLLNLAEKNNTIIQVGHVERFNSAVLGVRNSLSDPKFIECHRLGPFKSRSTDISIVLDLMIHDLDIILGLVKHKVSHIDAVGINVLSETAEDIASVRLRFANGTVCNITASRISRKTQRKIRIFQENTYISIDYEKQKAQMYTKNGDKISRQRVNIKQENPLKLELEDFIRCIRTKEKPLVSGQDGRDALECAINITETIRNENRKWLKIKS